MELEKTIEYIENSFLNELLKDLEITDISFNGDSLFYMHNLMGRRKSNIKITQTTAKDFLRQIANLTEKQFSFQHPTLDVSIGKYRINGLHQSIGRLKNEQTVMFSIRIASEKPKITDDSSFLTPELVSLFEALVNSHVSLVIGGATGTGKTEFQKYLLSKLPSFSRVVVIDSVLELDNLNLSNDIDINIWQSFEDRPETNIQHLVKNALRSNPDWLLVAEARGEEMIDVLNSAMTGHPIITTIHALSAESMPNRVGRMIMMNDKKMDFDDVMKDVFYHFHFFIFLKREYNKNGIITRYIQKIVEFDDDGKSHLIYQYKQNKHVYYPISEKTLEILVYDKESLFNVTFGGQK